jgi:anion-transporting  ArsA/GET3 family ATPase
MGNACVKELLRKGAIIVMLGAGGVGKTTITAALGLAAAHEGLTTALITVDPARRLREALGLQRLSAEPTWLDRRRLRAAGLDTSVRLSAMMLDVKRAWDRLVHQLVLSPEARARMLANPVYQNLTEQFAGAEAYAALEQLDELHRSGQFDIVIVDTPPAAHAFDFFEAPRRLVRLLDSPATRWLYTPEASLSRSAFNVASRAASFVVAQLEAFTGTNSLSSLSDFFSLAAQAAHSLSERLHETDAMIHSARVEFVLVTTPREDRLQDALELASFAERQKFSVRAVVLNRLLDERTFMALRNARRRPPRYLGEIARLRNLLGENDSKCGSLINYLETYRQHQMLEAERAVRFARELPTRTALAVIPALEPPVRDLQSLARLSSIFSPSFGRRFLSHSADILGRAARERERGRRSFAR